MSSSSFAMVDSLPTGGCSPPSSEPPRADAPACGSARAKRQAPGQGDTPIRAFAGAGELSRAQTLAAPVRWPRPSRLGEPLAAKGRLADGLTALGLETVGDLLDHLPRAHREARTVSALRPGEQ